jgi:hypothetical protein
VPKFFDFIGMIDLPSWLNPVIIGGVASLVVTIAVSRRTTVGPVESAYLARLHITPADELDDRKTRLTIVPAALLILNGLIAPVLLIVYYIRPYQRATGMLAADGSLDWFTGEVLLALSWSVVYVTLGVFTIRFFRKTYAPRALQTATGSDAAE